jgi:hypothetical protein
MDVDIRTIAFMLHLQVVTKALGLSNFWLIPVDLLTTSKLPVFWPTASKISSALIAREQILEPVYNNHGSHEWRVVKRPCQHMQQSLFKQNVSRLRISTSNVSETLLRVESQVKTFGPLAKYSLIGFGAHDMAHR